MSNPKPFLDKVVKIVQNRQFDQLACLAAEPYPVVAVKAINDVRDMLIDAIIVHPFPYGGFGCDVWCRREVFADVTLQHPTIVPVFVEISAIK